MALYFDSLKGSNKFRYEKRLQCVYDFSEKGNGPLGVQDPYQLPAEAWIDDPSLWPEVEFPNIYVYLIDTPGEFTRENLSV